MEIVSVPAGTTVISTELLAPAAKGESPFAAVIVTLVGDVTEGAVNRPLPVIEPAPAFHPTAVFGVDDTVATNCCVAPDEIVALEGESAILLEGLGVDAAGVDD